ncbi:hypothetical protein PENTCL1PPCAC_12180, partial [Pristionchus entomophagus]
RHSSNTMMQRMLRFAISIIKISSTWNNLVDEYARRLPHLKKIIREMIRHHRVDLLEVQGIDFYADELWQFPETYGSMLQTLSRILRHVL